MKKRIALAICSILITLTGCGSEVEQNVVMQKEPIPAAETPAAETPADSIITNDQALEAIRNYCFINNPDLETMAASEDYTVYFDVSTSEAGEIVVLYRSYTGAQIRYYVDPSSGEVYVTELVPGIIDDEQKTDETFNIRDYMSESGSTSTASRKEGERFEDVIMLESFMNELFSCNNLYPHLIFSAGSVITPDFIDKD